MSVDPKLSENRLITQEQIQADLRRIGLKKGDHVAVALSLKSIGFVLGGANAFIDAVLTVVGRKGTMMMNTFTKCFPLSEIQPDYVFDSSRTPAFTGLVPNTLLRRKGVIRSRHPTCSMAAIGRLSEWIMSNHNETANLFLPYERLAQIGGKYLCIGLGDRLVAIRHESQRKAGYFDFPPLFKLGVLYTSLEGENKLFKMNFVPCTSKLHEIVPKIELTSHLRRGKIGNADAILAPADKIIETMTAILKEQPALTLCEDSSCFYCRELERRKNLYPKILTPKLFQRNLFIRKLTELRVRYIVRQNAHVSFRDSTLKKVKPDSIIAFALRLMIRIALWISN